MHMPNNFGMIQNNIEMIFLQTLPAAPKFLSDTVSLHLMG